MKKNSAALSALFLFAFFLSAVFMFAGCASSKIVTMVGVQTEDVQKSSVQGNDVLVAQSGDLVVACSPGYITRGQGSVLFSISNKGNTSYSFTDKDIRIYAGNMLTGKWKLITPWSAGSFISREKGKLAAGNFFTALLGVALIVDAIFNPDSGDIEFGYSIPLPGGFSYYSSFSSGTSSALFPDLLMLSMIAGMQNEITTGSGKDYLHFIESNVLKSCVVPAGSDVAGWVFFNEAPYKMRDYRIEFTNRNTSQTSNFIYTRVD